LISRRKANTAIRHFVGNVTKRRWDSQRAARPFFLGEYLCARGKA
jgi:hypothetical protein